MLRQLYWGVFLSVVLSMANAVADPFQGAEWIRDPRFAGEQVLDVFTAQRTKKSTRLTNVHTYFRKEVALQAKPARAWLYVTGDDYYKLQINERFVVQGPEPGYPFAHPYYKLDVTPFLQGGSNCLAMHAYYHGLTTRAFNSADNRSGVMLRLEMTFSDGTTKTIITNGTWKCFACRTFSSNRVFGYATQFNENMDMRREPVGWRRVGFDDSKWQTPLVQRQDHHFVEQLTPPLEHWRADPLVFEKKAPGRYFLDFGGQVVGHTRLCIRGPQGHKMTVWHGEELSDPKTVRHEMRCNCDYQDTITLSGGDDLVEFYDYRGFRYVELIDAPEKPEVWADVRHHPFDEQASHFDSSDEVLNGIWKISKRGVQMGCQGIIVDCPTREKGQYTGDTYMTVLSHLILTADPTLTKKALIDYHLSQRFDPGMLAVAPGGFKQELAEWSLLWPVMLEYYYQMTGDQALVKELVEADALKKLIDWFAQLENEEGLLAGVDRHKWVLVDWPANLRAGYDYDATKNGVNTVINAFYHGTLRSAAALAQIAGRDGSDYGARADRLQAAMNRRLIHPTKGIYIDGLHEDGTPSPKTTLHAGSFALHFGVVPQANVAAVTELIRRHRLDCGLYGAPYLLAGLYGVGEDELAYELLTCRDKHSWHEMVRNGATTTMEAWAPELKWNTSWCHPACATPIWLIVQKLMGLQPGEPGFSTIRVAPRFPESLEWIEVRFPTVAGPVEARYEKGTGYRLTVPANLRVVDDTSGAIPLSVVSLPVKSR